MVLRQRDRGTNESVLNPDNNIIRIFVNTLYFIKVQIASFILFIVWKMKNN